MTEERFRNIIIFNKIIKNLQAVVQALNIDIKHMINTDIKLTEKFTRFLSEYTLLLHLKISKYSFLTKLENENDAFKSKNIF